MKYHSLFWLFFGLFCSAICLAGCRSDADRMAEFCLRFDEIVKSSSDCSVMSKQVDELLDPPQPMLRERNICSSTTACLPCRSAVREMLVRCGTEDEMKPVLHRMHFSKSLRALSDTDKP